MLRLIVSLVLYMCTYWHWLPNYSFGCSYYPSSYECFLCESIMCYFLVYRVYGFIIK